MALLSHFLLDEVALWNEKTARKREPKSGAKEPTLVSAEARSQKGRRAIKIYVAF